MAQNNNILQELQELKSSLGIVPGNIYSVPSGYFDSLAEAVLNKIKALEATHAKEELSYLSPLLNDLSRQMPYSVPQGYFDNLEKPILSAGHQSPDDELETLSPLLSGLKKQMPYSVPEGYFETLPVPGKQDAKLIKMSARKGWIRYAAAAVITGVIALTAFLVINERNSKPEIALKRFEKKLDKEIQKMSDTELVEFLESTESTMNGQENVSTNTPDEIKDLLKDVSESELKEFIEETSDLETTSTMLN